MITCPSCNHQNEVGSSFCENCGHDLRELAPSVPGAGLTPSGGGSSCSNCGFSNIPGAAFCENCGSPLVKETPSVPPPAAAQETPDQAPDPFQCSNCGHQNVPGSRFCENCGTELKKAAPVSPPQVAPEPQPQPEPEPQPQPEPEPQSQPQPEPVSHPAAAPKENTCSQCGFSNPPGTIFCGNCGMQLSETMAPPSPVADSAPSQAPAPASQAPSPVPAPSEAPPPKPTGMGGRFVVQPSGASIAVPASSKEVIIGREDPVSGIFPEIDLDPHGGHDGGVGRKHARLFLQNGQLMIEDQDSVNGTFVNRQKLNAFQPHPLQDGDEVRLGKIVLTYHAA